MSWSVRPEVAKIDPLAVKRWLADDVFDEDHALGVRNLAVNPDPLSQIEK